MPILKNARHEKFARLVANDDRDHGASYVEAGYGCKPEMAKRAAYTLLQRPDVQARIDEIRALNEAAFNKAIEKISLTKEWVVAELMTNVNAAKNKGDGSVVNRALELLGKELGIFVDRTEATNTIYGISDQPMSAEEWAKQYAGAPADKSKH